MTPTVIRTNAFPYARIFAASKTPAAYPTLAVLTNPPAIDQVGGFIQAQDDGNNPGNTLQFIFFGVATDGAVANYKLKRWKKIARPGSNFALLVPDATVFDLAVTFGAVTGSGIAPSPVLAAEVFGKSYATNSSKIAPGNRVWVPDDGIAMIEVDPAGAQFLQLICGPQVSGTVTSMNAGIAWM